MNKRNNILAAGFIALTLTGCVSDFNSYQTTTRFDSSYSSDVLDYDSLVGEQRILQNRLALNQLNRAARQNARNRLHIIDLQLLTIERPRTPIHSFGNHQINHLNAQAELNHQARLNRLELRNIQNKNKLRHQIIRDQAKRNARNNKKAQNKAIRLVQMEQQRAVQKARLANMEQQQALKKARMQAEMKRRYAPVRAAYTPVARTTPAQKRAQAWKAEAKAKERSQQKARLAKMTQQQALKKARMHAELKRRRAPVSRLAHVPLTPAQKRAQAWKAGTKSSPTKASNAHKMFKKSKKLAELNAIEENQINLKENMQDELKRKLAERRRRLNSQSS